MDNFINFQQYLEPDGSEISLAKFIFNLISTAIFCHITAFIYTKFGNSLSSRESFSKNFVLMGITTMLIITIVKSSLALSLGLVGALSVIRFRTAIKEPEELTFLFLIISIGLGFGADQGKIIASAFIFIIIIIIAINKTSLNFTNNENLLFSVSIKSTKHDNLKEVIKILEMNCSMVSLKRFDEDKESIDASFSINIQNINSLSKMKESVLKLDNSARVQFLDNKDIH
jgi:hypothetical protein